MPQPPGEGLNVIALVSGGKDSFFSLLHCRANGHRVVALANLHPPAAPPPPPPPPLQRAPGPSDDTSHAPAATKTPAVIPAASAAALQPGAATPADQDGSPASILPVHEGGAAGNDDEHDLNSFMYQTVGHQVIPLYAEATGIPLYRRAIAGGAAQHGKEYSHYGNSVTPAPETGTDSGPGGPRGRQPSSGLVPESGGDGKDTIDVEPDETESMVPLLQAIKAAHPEANAICAGAILSTYQRTRVESVATRLGLTPLAYLWKFPVLPTPPGPSNPSAGSDAQLLDDMAAAGLEARIIKVASGGLDDAFLWTNVASAVGKGKLARAMRRFGAAETGAVIGEGGEFETLVLDGPSSLFRKRIVVAEEDRRVVREGGGSAWLMLRNARVESKEEGEGGGVSERLFRIPDLLDPRFVGVLDVLSSPEAGEVLRSAESTSGTEDKPTQAQPLLASTSENLQQWCFISENPGTVEAETQSIIDRIRLRLRQHALSSSAIVSATVVLRRMADFPAVNGIYGTLFDAPNPASRVTISCGDALATTNIAVYLTVHTALAAGQRHGLHVQSRSYWAPANIGPYGQAVSIPVASLVRAGRTEDDNGAGVASSLSSSASDAGPRLVSIAGQIPLVPATMALPSEPASGDKGIDGDGLPLQLALSLQHLWRVGAEMGVQWWSSAVAYFPRTGALSGEEGKDREGAGMARKAALAARAWRTAHLFGSSNLDDEEDDENGPDLWDRRYNPEYRTFAGGADGAAGGEAAPVLPDRSVLASKETAAAGAGAGAAPPLFVAEVDELPRGAGVEWHAHLGVAHAGEGSVVLRRVALPVSGDGGGGEGDAGQAVVSQVVVTAQTGEGQVVRFVQTVVAEPLGGHSLHGVLRHGQVAKASLEALGEVGAAWEPVAVVRYVDAGLLGAAGGGAEGTEVGPVVPCRSLWDDGARRLAAVTVYHSVFGER